MSGFGYNVLGFGANASSAAGGASDDEFNRVSFLSHFEGSNNGVNNVFDDGSDSNHTITANGNVTQGSFGPFARPDGEWAFNNTGSTNDSFKVTAHDNFDMTNPFTIEGWIFLSDVTANKLLFGRENNYWMTHDYQGIGGASGKFGFNYQNSGSWGAINASAATVANTWYFLQATYVGTTVTFYINGVSQGTASVGSPSSNTDKPFYVLSGPGVTTTGTASNVRLSSVARSTSLPTSKFTSDSDTELLVCQSNRFVDNGPDGHTITTTVGASVTSFGPFLTNAVYDPAVNGGSAYFDGNGDYLDTPTGADFELDANYTVEGWFYQTVREEGSALFELNDYRSGILFRLGNASSIYDNWYINGTDYDSPAASFPLNQWNHFAMTRDGSTNRLFANGVQIATASVSGDINSTQGKLRIGGIQHSTGQQFDGYVSDFRLIKGTAVYTGNFTPPTAPLTAITNTKLLLNMGDGQAIDSAAQNNLTLYGTAKLSTGQKKFGTASMLFDGTGDYALTDVTPLGTGMFTIECFYYALSRGDPMGLFEIAASALPGNTTGLAMFNRSSTYNYNWGFFCGGTQTNSTTAPDLNTWYHVALVRDSNSLISMYVNGSSVCSATNTTNLVGTVLTIGDYYSAAYGFHGYLDEFRISRGVARYTSNFTAPAEAFPDKGQ